MCYVTHSANVLFDKKLVANGSQSLFYPSNRTLHIQIENYDSRKSMLVVHVTIWH